MEDLKVESRKNTRRRNNGRHMEERKLLGKSLTIMIETRVARILQQSRLKWLWAMWGRREGLLDAGKRSERETPISETSLAS